MLGVNNSKKGVALL